MFEHRWLIYKTMLKMHTPFPDMVDLNNLITRDSLWCIIFHKADYQDAIIVNNSQLQKSLKKAGENHHATMDIMFQPQKPFLLGAIQSKQLLRILLLYKSVRSN